MKNFLALGVMLVSMNAFSQSYLILNNGITLTTDNAGFMYDFGHFRAPYKVTVTGGQFMIEDKKLSTVDTSGFLYEKDEKVDKVKGKGLNYLINDDNKLITIASNGFFFKYDEDSKIFKKAKAFGGNYFTAEEKKNTDIYTINSVGNYFKTNIDGLNPADISSHGGTYFQTRNGVVYTISKDGFIYPKKEVMTGSVVKKGGNFFIDSTNKLFTVSEEGFLMLPVLPMNLKVSKISKLGANYMLDSEGRAFVVDKNGKLFERTIDHDLSSAKILSL